MRKNRFYRGLLNLLVILALSSCHVPYAVTDIDGRRVAITSQYDAYGNDDMIAFVGERKSKLAEEMSPVICRTPEIISSSGRNFNPLANTVSDIVRISAMDITGENIDFAVVNIGGLRCDLPAGDITVGTAFELLPFMNTLCVMDMKGSDVIELFRQIAAVGGEGVSKGVILNITKEGKLVDCSIGGKPVEDEKVYRIATIDYLAEGNDGMLAFKSGYNRTFPEDGILRDLFINYVRNLTEEGKMLEPQKDVRINVK